MSNLVVQTWDRGIDAENGATAPTEEFYRITAFFPIVDNVIHEMERRFNDEETLPLLQSIGACHSPACARSVLTSEAPWENGV
jgi:hypothetical protein